MNKRQWKKYCKKQIALGKMIQVKLNLEENEIFKAISNLTIGIGVAE